MNVFLCGKRNFEYVIKGTIFIGGDYFVLFGWILNVVNCIFIRGR